MPVDPRPRERATAYVRLDGPGVTHDYVSCGECGAPLSPYSFLRKRDCETHTQMARVVAAREHGTRDATVYFHYQPDHGTFGSCFLKQEFYA